MAKSTIISFALIFSTLLLMVLIAESRPAPTVADPICNAVHGVEERETCTSIIQRFNLDERHFLDINPNINCNLIFVGQWVCVDGKVI
ncbi:cell wall macromolecule catabolic process [Spatholobus suberectus]|nr:cell wall macromolecule catabolic process [Spatholobus suberectus]